MNKETPLYFAADTAAVPDSAVSTIRAWLSTVPLPVQALNQSVSVTANYDSTLVIGKKRKALIEGPPPEPSTCNNSTDVKFEQKQFTILLGESKYYYVVENGDEIEIKDDGDFANPPTNRLPGATFDDLVAANGSEKNPIYWEYKKPDGTDLPQGMVRLIGRYWEEEKTFKATVTAHANGKDASIDVEVKKPTVLGNLDLTDVARHSIVRDVFGKDFNLDSMIIQYAGKYGIPPQIIKGQMQKETAFNPAWRYEPFEDIRIQNSKDLTEKYFDVDMPFVIDVTSMGAGDKPDLHTNESPSDYVDTSTKIGVFVVEYWFSRYVRRHTGDAPDTIIGSTSLTKRWKEIYDQIKKNKPKIIDSDARTQAHNKLKNEIQDSKSHIGKSFDNIAQTRKITSYGFVQMMYTTATGERFNLENNDCYSPTQIYYIDQNDEHIFPEKLNEQGFLLPRYCDFLWKKLNFTSTSCLPTDNWTDGFEAKWKAALRNYNLGEAGYAGDVMANAENYLPVK